MTLSLTVTLENSQNYPCFRVKFAFFCNLWHLKNSESVCRRGQFLGYLPILYFVLPLTCAVMNVLGSTIIFHNFPEPTIKLHDFPGLENKTLEFHDFPGIQ